MAINTGNSRSRHLAVIQVDGLSHNHLNQALDRGLMPHLKERFDRGTLNLDSYNTGLPSQTAVVIGGLFYGQLMPGNQWYDKKSGQVMDTFKLANAHEIEDSLSASGDGLAKGGSVYVSPLTGGADPEESFLVFSDMSRVLNEEGQWGLVKSSAAKLWELGTHMAAHPIKALQSAVRFGSEMAHDLRHRKETHRSVKSVLQDTLKETLIADAASQRIADQIRAGEAPFLYLDLGNFDAKNHVYGLGEEAFQSLPHVDQNLDTILDAVEESETPYEIAILADHGSVTGYGFHELHGQTLQEKSQELAPEHDVLALDFGSGAHIYLEDVPGELNRSELPEDLVSGLRDQPGIAFTVTREGDATLIESRSGQVKVTGDQIDVVGNNPLAEFEENTDLTAHQIHDLAHRDKAGDLLVFGELHKDGLVNFSVHHKGLHGGIGLDQTQPFVAWSPGLPLSPGQTEDAADLHHQLNASYLRSQTST
jgi:hypothetical protein